MDGKVDSAASADADKKRFEPESEKRTIKTRSTSSDKAYKGGWFRFLARGTLFLFFYAVFMLMLYLMGFR